MYLVASHFAIGEGGSCVAPSPGGLWIVQVTEPGPPHTGGGMAVMIDKHSGCIVNVMPYMK